MVSSPLDVQGSQIEVLSEETGGQYRRQEFIHSPRVLCHQSPEDGISAKAEPELIWIEEGIDKVQRTSTNWLEVGAKSVEEWSDQRVPIPVGCSGKGIGDTRVNAWIIPSVWAEDNVIHCFAKDLGKVVEVGDLLYESTDDPPGLLVEPLIIPVGVDSAQLTSNAVVLTEPDGVHDCEHDLFIHTKFSGQEAAPGPRVGAAKQWLSLLIHVLMFADDGQLWLVPGEVCPLPQQSSLKQSNFPSQLFIRSVHHRGIDEGGENIELFTSSEDAIDLRLCAIITLWEGAGERQAVCIVLCLHPKHWITVRHKHWLTDFSELTAPLWTLVLQLWAQGEVMVQELPPLHENVRQALVLTHITDDSLADESSAGVGWDEGTSRDHVALPGLEATPQGTDTILILCGNEASECCVSGPKERVLQVVACTINGSEPLECWPEAPRSLPRSAAALLLDPCQLLLCQLGAGFVEQFTGQLLCSGLCTLDLCMGLSLHF